MSLFERDFDALEPGERFATPGRSVSEADIAQFAALIGDTHPQHVDSAWAAGSRFGEQIAHALLVLSFAVFKQPVLIGDTVHVEGEVVSVRPIDEENGLVECRWRVLNQHGRLVLRASVELVWRRAAVREPILL